MEIPKLRKKNKERKFGKFEPKTKIIMVNGLKLILDFRIYPFC